MRKSILITGASSGIGYALSYEMARRGYSVGLAARRIEILEKMRELGIKKKRAFYEESIGKTHKVLLEEKRDDKTGFLKGLTSNYISVLSDGPDCHKNKITDISIDRLIDNNSVSGTILMTS